MVSPHLFVCVTLIGDGQFDLGRVNVGVSPPGVSSNVSMGKNTLGMEVSSWEHPPSQSINHVPLHRLIAGIPMISPWLSLLWLVL